MAYTTVEMYVLKGVQIQKHVIMILMRNAQIPILVSLFRVLVV